MGRRLKLPGSSQHHLRLLRLAAQGLRLARAVAGVSNPLKYLARAGSSDTFMTFQLQSNIPLKDHAIIF